MIEDEDPWNEDEIVLKGRERVDLFFFIIIF